MSLVADALQPFLVTGLTSLQGRPSGLSLVDLIGKQDRFGFDLDFDNSNESIVTDFRDPSPVLDSVASDSSRFASAAFQTMESIPEAISGKDEIAWSIIRSYYAAFYAGHSITRLFGESCSYFDRSHMARISRLASAYGKTPNFNLHASVYRCNLDVSARCITSKSLRNSQGGAHETFWNIFGLRMSQIGEDILKGPLSQLESQSVFSKLYNLQNSIGSNGAPFHSWLSVMRNDIQYRHRYGVWLPCKVRRQDRERLGRLIGQWKRDPMDIDVGMSQGGPLGEFAVACAFIVALCRSLLNRID
jgi:hypothetical protein